MLPQQAVFADWLESRSAKMSKQGPVYTACQFVKPFSKKFISTLLHRRTEPMKGSEAKMIGFMEGADKRYVIPVYQRKYDWKYHRAYHAAASDTGLDGCAWQQLC